jgi:gephyrin
VLISSDRISAGAAQDVSGRAAAEILAGICCVDEIRVVPDDLEAIANVLREWSDSGVRLVVTVGGTGLSPRDVTPEATRAVIDREAAGISGALLVRGLQSTPRAMLSRACAGVRGNCLIINLPGSTSAVRELLDYLLPVLPHALETVAGAPEEYAD